MPIPASFQNGYPMTTETEITAAHHEIGGEIIAVRNVDKFFGGFQALRNIDLSVSRGERIVICGPSGSGKSTLIRCLNQLEEHQKGDIVVDEGACQHARYRQSPP